MSILSKVFSAGAGDLIKKVGGVIDNLHTSAEEKAAAEKQIKDMIMGYEAEMQKQVTERWKLDKINFNVKDSYVDLLQLVLITVIGAYFGGRSLEKVKK
jgi:hypothetical protein